MVNLMKRMNYYQNSNNKNKVYHNKVLPKTWLNSFDWTFVQDSTSVLRLR